MVDKRFLKHLPQLCNVWYSHETISIFIAPNIHLSHTWDDQSNLLLQTSKLFTENCFFSSTTSTVKNVYLKSTDSVQNCLFSTCLA